MRVESIPEDITKESIIESLFQGMRQACLDAIHFNGRSNPYPTPEYLVTVNVAQHLFKNRKAGDGMLWTLHLENSTKKAATRSVPLLGQPDPNADIFDPILTSGFHNTKRNGKFDIAICSEDDGCPYYLIEIKGHNPKINKILIDIDRIVDIHRIADANTGLSRVECGFVSYIKEQKVGKKANRSRKDEDRQEERAKALADLSRQLDDKKQEIQEYDLEMEVKVKTVKSFLLGPQAQLIHEDGSVDEGPYGDEGPELPPFFHYIGIVISISKVIDVKDTAPHH